MAWPLLRWSLTSLALLLFAAAVWFPAQDIENRRITAVDQMRQDSALKAAQLQPNDDPYVRPLNVPYPINVSKLFPWVLCIDGVLLIALAVIAPRRRLSTGGGARTALITYARRDWGFLLLLTIAAAALRGVGSGRNLWIDEIGTMTRYVRGPLTDILVQTSTTNNHLLNSLLSYITIAVFGEHEWALRLPAVVFGTVTVLLFYLVVRRFSSRVEATLAALTLALSYHHVFFSQESRGYAGMLFGGLLGTLALIEALEHGSPWAWVAYCSGMLICVGSVATGMFVLVGQLIAVTLYRPTRAFYAMFGLVAWLLLHFYFFVIPDLLAVLSDEYMRPEAGWRLSTGLVQAFLQGLRLGPAAIPILVAAGTLVAIGIWSYFRQDRLFAALLLAPEALMLLLMASLKVGFYPRNFLYSLPVVVAFAARGIHCSIEMLPVPLQRWSHAAAFTGMFVASVFLLQTWWNFPMQDYLSARRYVESRLEKGDAVVTMGSAQGGFRYYWPQIQVEDRVSSLQVLMNRSNRVWILYSFPRDMDQRFPKLIQFVREKFEEQIVFPGMVIDGDILVCLYTGADDSRSID